MVEHVVAQRTGATPRNDFLQALLDGRDKNAGNHFDANSLPGHALSFLTEGYETSATTMSYCLYELARQPTVQERCRAEAVAAFGSGTPTITEDGMQRLPLLEQAVYESLRLHSAVFSIQRVCTRDIELPAQFEGAKPVVITKGTPVILPVFSMHM